MQPLICPTNEDSINPKQRNNGKLYDAVMEGDQKKVIELCQRLPDHALHIITVNDDTVLHMATYAREAKLVHKLLDELPAGHLDKMTRQNAMGNTILHEAATSNHAISIAEKLLTKAPGLLGMRNHNGETALFRATRYGNTDMFKFLDAKIANYDKEGQQFYLQRSDKTTVLHIAILSQHFDLAMQIANCYKHLIGQEDSDGMTGLQLLSCYTSAFKYEQEDGFMILVKSCCSSAWRKEVQKKRKKYESTVELAKFLVQRDISWEVPYISIDQSKPKIHKYGVDSDAFPVEKRVGPGLSANFPRQIGQDTPLILATKSGCVEIVSAILKLYPQAVEYTDDNGRTLLHVAIRNRQLQIFNLVKRMDVPMNRLLRRTDNYGNTILHIVGIKRKDFASEKIESPVFLLQEELQWFERVEEIIPDYLMHHRNNDNLTAYAFFLETNSELRNVAKEWLKRTSEGCSVVAVLIATVAFAAAYTVPGGNQSSGFPILLNQPFFVVFTATDVLSLTFALTSVVTFLSILSSPNRVKDFKQSLPNKLMLGFTFLFLSVAMMMIAFGATIILMIHNRESWPKITLYTLSFIPVGVFALSNFPLYLSQARTYRYLPKIWKARIQSIPLKVCSLFKFCKVHTASSSIPI